MQSADEDRPAGATSTPPTTRPLRGGALLLLSCTSVQLGAATAITTFGAVGPTGATGLRFAFAATLLLAVRRPRFRSWDRATARIVAVYGIAAAANELCLYLAFSRLPQGMAVTLEFLGPLSLALLEAGTWRRAWVVIAALCGVALLSRATFTADPLGILLALTAATGWAGLILVSRGVGDHLPPLDALVAGMGVAALITSPLAALHVSQLTWSTGWRMLVTAALGTLLPYYIELYALRELSPGTAGVLFSMEPAIAAESGWLVLGQHLGEAQLVGVLLVVLAGAATLSRARD